jgi:putative chitinase
MILTEDQFRQMMPNGAREGRLDAHWPYVVPALERACIDTPNRIAAFLAQLAHESGEFRWMEEIWGPTAQQLGYEGRADLGNVYPGDGYRFRGRAGIGLTGRANYRQAGNDLGVDLVTYPDKAATPEYATAISTWFWNSRQLSPVADMNWIKTITKVINGGYNGLEDRIRCWNRNRVILGLQLVDPDNEKEVIRAFQAMHGLIADGDAGPITRAKLVMMSGTCVPPPGWDPAKVTS